MAGAQSPQEKIDASNQVDSALSRLLVVVENYPNLKANENFRQLQFSLEGTENRILQARRRYNEAVQKYNTDLSLFPANLSAPCAASRVKTRTLRPSRARASRRKSSSRHLLNISMSTPPISTPPTFANYINGEWVASTRNV